MVTSLAMNASSQAGPQGVLPFPEVGVRKQFHARWWWAVVEGTGSGPGLQSSDPMRPVSSWGI